MLALVAVAAFVAGCRSQQDPSEYSERLERTLNVRNEVVAQMGADKLSDEAEYQSVRDRVQGALDELDADPPPKDFKRAHQMLVDGLDGLGVLLGKLARCEALERSALQDARACRQSIGQDVFDTLRNDFAESDAIYRQEGLSLPALGGEDDDPSDSGGGDVLTGS